MHKAKGDNHSVADTVLELTKKHPFIQLVLGSSMYPLHLLPTSQPRSLLIMVGPLGPDLVLSP